jgi:hypothetical protein
MGGPPGGGMGGPPPPGAPLPPQGPDQPSTRVLRDDEVRGVKIRSSISSSSQSAALPAEARTTAARQRRARVQYVERVRRDIEVGFWCTAVRGVAFGASQVRVRVGARAPHVRCDLVG